MRGQTKFEKRLKLYKKIKVISCISISIFIFIFVYIDFDKRLYFATENIIKTKSNTIMSDAIDETITEILKTSNVESSNFYTPRFNKDGELLTIEINTILINNLCSTISTNISEQLSTIEQNSINIPLFSLYDINLIYGIGPIINAEILPMGYADVNYSSNFSQAGINQTNFELWLDVTCYLQMKYPITQNVVVQNKRVPLISTIINGSVPDYFN